jgi:hypothetical protein
MRRYVISAVMAAFLVAGCGSKGGSPNVDTEGGVGSVDFSMTMAPSFGGNSVKICGDRAKDADSKCPCLSHRCQCFNFDREGVPVDAHGGPARFEELCPTADYPVANWTFSYTVYGVKDCLEPGENPTQHVITSPMHPDSHNFVCYEANNLADQECPNKSIAPVVRGENCSEMVCVTTNASASWDFGVCVDVSKKAGGCSSNDKACWAPSPPDQLVLDCGCWPTLYFLDLRRHDPVALRAEGALAPLGYG